MSGLRRGASGRLDSALGKSHATREEWDVVNQNPRIKNVWASFMPCKWSGPSYINGLSEKALQEEAHDTTSALVGNNNANASILPRFFS